MLMINEMLDRLRYVAQGEEGEVTIEWGVLVVFIALALIAVVGVIVGGINNWFAAIAAFIAGTAPA